MTFRKKNETATGGWALVKSAALRRLVNAGKTLNTETSTTPGAWCGIETITTPDATASLKANTMSFFRNRAVDVLFAKRPNTDEALGINGGMWTIVMVTMWSAVCSAINATSALDGLRFFANLSVAPRFLPTLIAEA